MLFLDKFSNFYMQDGNQPVKFEHPLEELRLNNKIGKIAKSFGGPSYYSGTYALSCDSKNNNKNTTFFLKTLWTPC